MCVDKVACECALLGWRARECVANVCWGRFARGLISCAICLVLSQSLTRSRFSGQVSELLQSLARMSEGGGDDKRDL